MMGHIQVDGCPGIRLVEEGLVLVTISLRCLNHGLKVTEVRYKKVLDNETR